MQLLGETQASLPGRNFALNPADGSLAVYDGAKLTLYGRDATVRWQREAVGLEDGALVFAGEVLVAGNTAYQVADGTERWSHPEGGRLTAVGDDVFVRSGARAIAGYSSIDGTRLWSFDLPPDTKLVAVAGGFGRVAVAARGAGGDQLLILDAAGQLHYNGRFQVPVEGVTVAAGGRVLLLLPDNQVAEVDEGR